MRNKKIKEEKNIKNKEIKKIKKEIPDEIKILYGKFYVFSFIYIFFFGVLYPFLFMERIKAWASILLFLLLGSFYIYMIVDVIKHKGRFNSTKFTLLILLVVMAFSFSIVKFVV